MIKLATATGFKTTNLGMRCRQYQYRLGEWHEFHGEPYIGRYGFHFCTRIVDCYNYYKVSGTRLFEIEAEDVQMEEPIGASQLCVAKRIRLVREIDPPVDSWGNIGTHNNGQCNEGHRNVGESNLGDLNQGRHNVGGNNIGYENRGNFNIGDHNHGHNNIGMGNTGDYCTGVGNVGVGVTGYFCSGTGTGEWFDLPADPQPVSRSILELLASDLSSDTPFDYDGWDELPNYTPERMQALHEKHIAWRKIGSEEKS